MEAKRHGRAYPDVINGRSVATCRELGLLVSGASDDESIHERDGGAEEGEKEEDLFVTAPAASTDESQSGFAEMQSNDTVSSQPLDSTMTSSTPPPATSPFGVGLGTGSIKTNPFATTAAALKANPFQAANALGRTSETAQAPINPFAKAAAALNANLQGTGSVEKPSFSGTTTTGPAPSDTLPTSLASPSLLTTGVFPTLAQPNTSPFGTLAQSTGLGPSPITTTNASRPPSLPSFASLNPATSNSASFRNSAISATSESPQSAFNGFVETLTDGSSGQASDQIKSQPLQVATSVTPSPFPTASLSQPPRSSTFAPEQKLQNTENFLVSLPAEEKFASVGKQPFPPPLQLPPKQTLVSVPASSDKLMSGALSASPSASSFGPTAKGLASTAALPSGPPSIASARKLPPQPHAPFLSPLLAQAPNQRPAAPLTSDVPSLSPATLSSHQQRSSFRVSSSKSSGTPHNGHVEKPKNQKPALNATEMRRKVISELAFEYFFEGYGILDQALEYLVGEVVFKDESEKVKREQERQQLYDAQLQVFGKRYFLKWKNLTWTRYMAKRGNSFRQSMQKMQEEALRVEEENAESVLRSTTPATDEAFERWLQQMKNENAAKKSSSPTDTPRAVNLSATIGVANGDCVPNSNSRAVLSLETKGIANGLPISREFSSKRQKVNKPGHRYTQSQQVKATAPQRGNEPSHRSSLDSSRSHFSETVNPTQQQTRCKRHKDVMENGASGDRHLSDDRDDFGRSSRDTTRTDYFALKARGIPPVPQSLHRITKRARGFDGHSYSHATRIKLPRFTSTERHSRPSTESRPTSGSSSQALERDGLFQRVDALRDVLAEGEAWFREQRLRMEREDTEAAERKQLLRRTGRSEEWRSSPSRTSQRIQAAGGAGLWGRAEKYFKAEMDRRAGKNNGVTTENGANALAKTNGVKESTLGSLRSTNGVEEIDFDVEENEDEEGLDDLRDGDYQFMQEDEEDDYLEDDVEAEEEIVVGVQGSQFHGMGTSAEDAIEL